MFDLFFMEYKKAVPMSNKSNLKKSRFETWSIYLLYIGTAVFFFWWIYCSKKGLLSWYIAGVIFFIIWTIIWVIVNCHSHKKRVQEELSQLTNEYKIYRLKPLKNLLQKRDYYNTSKVLWLIDGCNDRLHNADKDNSGSSSEIINAISQMGLPIGAYTTNESGNPYLKIVAGCITVYFLYRTICFFYYKSTITDRDRIDMLKKDLEYIAADLDKKINTARPTDSNNNIAKKRV